MKLFKYVFIITGLLSNYAYANESLNTALQALFSDGNSQHAEFILGRDILQGNNPLAGNVDPTQYYLSIYETMNEFPENREKIALIAGMSAVLNLSPEAKGWLQEGEPSNNVNSPDRMNSIYYLLNAWTNSLSEGDRNKALNVKLIFEAWAKATKVQSSNLVYLPQSSSNSVAVYEQIPFYVLHNRMNPEVLNFALRLEGSSSLIDRNGWNIAMIAAVYGNLRALKTMKSIYGKEEATRLFNFRSSENFLPTVLHAAVSSVKFVSVESAFQMIDYLTKNGANPGQRSMYHSLVEEAAFWVTQDPENANKYLALKKVLKENLTKLAQNYTASLSSSNNSLTCRGFLSN